MPKQLAEIVETATGGEMGEWVQQRLMNAWSLRPVSPRKSLLDLERLINDLENTGKVQRGEKVQ